MNILILSWRGPRHPNAGGAESSTHEHAKGWVKAGNHVTLFTSAFPGCKKQEIIDGIEIRRNGRQIFGVQWEAFKWYVFGKHTKFDIVIDQFHGIPFFTPLYVREKKLAFIHEITKEVWGLNTLFRPFNLFPAILGRILEPLIFLFYKKIPFMTVSESTRDDLTNWGIKKNDISVIHNGTSLEAMKLIHEKEKEKTVIYLGVLNKDKGIEDAIKVFNYLSQKNPTWKFWVVGRSSKVYLNFLKKMSMSFGIKNIKFWGFVDERQKFELLSKAHILINPSIREGWGLVVIEAAAVGTPTVGYNVAGLRDSIKDKETGLLCDPNPRACAQEVLSLLNDLNRYKKLQANCKKWSKRFRWSRSSKRSLQLIEKIIKI